MNRLYGLMMLVLTSAGLNCISQDSTQRVAHGDFAGDSISPDTLIYPVTADTSVRANAPNANYGTSNHLHMHALDHAASLQSVEVTTIGDDIAHLDTGMVTISASFTGHLAGTLPSSPFELYAHHLTQSWTEGGATWNCPNDTNTGNSALDCAGGTWDLDGPTFPWDTFTTAYEGSINSTDTEAVIGMNMEVMSMLSGNAPYGWIIGGEEGESLDTVKFDSIENSNPSELSIAVDNGEVEYGLHRLTISTTDSIFLTVPAGIEDWDIKSQAIDTGDLSTPLSSSSLSLGTTHSLAVDQDYCHHDICTVELTPSVFGKSSYDNGFIYIVSIWPDEQSQIDGALIVSFPAGLPDTVNDYETVSSDHGIWVAESSLMDLSGTLTDAVVLQYSDFYYPNVKQLYGKHYKLNGNWKWHRDSPSWDTSGAFPVLDKEIGAEIMPGMGASPYIYISPRIAPRYDTVHYYVMESSGGTDTIWADDFRFDTGSERTRLVGQTTDEHIGGTNYPLPALD